MNTYNTKSFNRFASFVYDVFNHCQVSGFFSIRKICKHHRVSNTSAVLALKEAGRLKVTTLNGRNVYSWNGGMPEISDLKKLYGVKFRIESEMNAAKREAAKQEMTKPDLFTQPHHERVLPYRVGRPLGEGATKETGCRPGEARFTTILEKDLIDDVRKLAYWDRRTVKAIITLALEAYVKDYVKKNGPLLPIPEDRYPEI